MSDFQTGKQLAIAGRIPYVANAGVVTPPALALLEEAGLPVEAELHVYDSSDEYSDLLRWLTARGLRHAVQRPHPEDDVPSAAAVVRRDLQCDLNDKGRMEDLVPAAWLPLRRLLEVSEIPRAEDLIGGGRPIVMKAASRLPSGGGRCVWICRTAEDVEIARAALCRERFVVIEEFLRIRRSVCLHAVVLPDGAVSVAGFAEQVCSADGRYLGNWLDTEADALPPEVVQVVLQIVQGAARRGYRGIAGVDVAFPEDGPPRVLDLNFRVNGSTAAAWLRGSIERKRGAGSMRLRAWACESGFDDLLRIVRGAMNRGALIPLCLYDPAACAAGGLPRLHSILSGPSREAVREEECHLAAEGLT
jgi:hypothetical protein